MVAVRATLHRNDYKDKEIRASWYSPTENSVVYNDAKDLIRKLNEGHPMDEHELSACRGLECRTRHQSIKKTQIRELAREIVREEQERQWDAGTDDPDRLAIAYFSVSNMAHAEAVYRGRLDALAASK